MTALALVRKAILVVWDFDGVIKESLGVKTDAFAQLFAPYGPDVVARVKAHHEAHGGMSRFEKIPIYLGYAGEEVTETRVNGMCQEFARLVQQRVVDSPWVPGVEHYLRSNPHRQVFVLVSATPQSELEQIVQSLRVRECFADVFGAPTGKTEAIRLTLTRHSTLPEDSLMIGDAGADLEAARANRVPFVLRRHATNLRLFADYQGPSISDMTE